MKRISQGHISSRLTSRIVLGGIIVALFCVEWAGTRAAGPAKRALPPKFDKTVTDVFFPDAREKLVGPRPEKANRSGPQGAAPESPADASPKTVDGGAGGWPALISAEAIEDEIKAQHRQLGEAVQNPVKFKGGDYKRARQHLSVLAALFAIAADYGQPIRWQREAGGVRDLLARAGFNCKVGTDASHAEARRRHEDLENLIRGESIEAAPASPEATWNTIADRAPLMKRLEQAHDQGLAPWTANAQEFSRRAERIAHEAQLIAALAAVIQREGYEFADDETYRKYAEAMRAQALAAREAAETSNYERARDAVGELAKACSNCHEGYRN
jgi:hypothetical protein